MSQRKLYESDYYLRAFLCLEVVMFIFTPTEGIGLLTDQNNAVVEDLQSSHEEVILLKEQNRHLPRTCRTGNCVCNQCCCYAGPTSKTVAQHQNNIGYALSSIIQIIILCL